MRLAIYGCISTVLAIGVILSAMYQRSNFFSACIYLSKSSACMMILLNMGFILSVLFGKVLQAIFFGRLRAIEVEHLYERSWYAVTETCLAMTIFREEFDLHFIVVFTTLLFLKIFHWLCQDRVEFMEQTPANSVGFHVRIVNLLCLLLMTDTFLANHAIYVTLTKGPSMMIIFGFEYTILICTILSTIGRYIINLIDMRTEQTWEAKSMYIFYLDLITDFFKLVTYLVFFLYICLNYQLPIHIIRDVYVTFKSFIQKCRDLYRYRRATRNLNELYPNATAEDLSRANDSTCIICREEMHANGHQLQADGTEDNADMADSNVSNNISEHERHLEQPKKLPCGHIFHFHCLRSWLERQQSCPTCRRSVLTDSSQSTNTSNNNQMPPAAQSTQATQPQQQQPQPQTTPFPQPQPTQTPQAQPSPFWQPQPQSQRGYFNQQPVFSSPFSATPATSSNNNSNLNILTPATQPSPNHLNIPGLIPLVPINNSLNQQQLGQSNMNSGSDTPSSLPLNLSEQDLQILAQTTRESMEQRLRILETVQNQIFQTIQTLTQALSVIPLTNTNSDHGARNIGKEKKSYSEDSENDDDAMEIDSVQLQQSHSTSTSGSISERKRGKMPDRSATAFALSDDEEEDY